LCVCFFLFSSLLKKLFCLHCSFLWFTFVRSSILLGIKMCTVH
jgi:hypothetical protein